ncbi:MAG: hypothetical protein GX099_02100, partial [Clostridiaceae bacterium]|nr:hypothetical protein [Clostridiaceae bacterium]
PVLLRAEYSPVGFAPPEPAVDPEFEALFVLLFGRYPDPSDRRGALPGFPLPFDSLR